MTVAQTTDASFAQPLDWKSIDWNHVQERVRRLQVRIAKATQSGKNRQAQPCSGS